MNNYKFDDVVTSDVIASYNKNQKNKIIDELVNKINSFNSMFTGSDLPTYEIPEFVKLDDVSVSNDEIKKSAEDSLNDYKQSELRKIDESFIAKENTLNKNKETLTKSNDAHIENINNYYDNARQNASDDALRRGLARSSIVINKLDAFNNEEIDKLSKLNDEFVQSINAIDFELNSLGQLKSQALNDFDIAYAVKLNDKISKLQADLEKKQIEITKYNNEIIKQENDYNIKYQNLINDINNDNANSNKKILDLVGKYGEKVVNNYRKNQIIDIVEGYFKDMSKNEIIDILNNDSRLRKSLGVDLDYFLDRYK